MTDVQGRLFNPDNPPLAFPKEDAKLDEIRNQLKEVQMDRIREHNVRKHGHE